jgi:hypothetical protein
MNARRRLAIGLPLLALVAGGLLRGAPAAHADMWCFDDPLVSVGGRLLDIRAGMPTANLLSARTTTLTVIIPQNVSGAVLVDDISAFPLQTTIVASGPVWGGSGPLPVTVRSYVAAATPFPTNLTVTPLVAPGVPLGSASSAFGSTNTPLTLTLTLGG